MGQIGNPQREFEVVPVELPLPLQKPAPKEAPIQVPVEPEKVPV